MTIGAQQNVSVSEWSDLSFHMTSPRNWPHEVPRTCFANLYSQFGEFALQYRLLLLGHVGFFLLSLLHFSALRTLQRLHLHGNSSILLFGWWAGHELASLHMDNKSVMSQLRGIVRALRHERDSFKALKTFMPHTEYLRSNGVHTYTGHTTKESKTNVNTHSINTDVG